MTSQELVAAALRIDPADRAAYLEKACAGDAALLNEVSMMLAGNWPAGDATLTLEPQTQADSESESIGPYELLQKIGEGGMGVVYRAQQHAPIRRNVALKLIKPGMDSQQVIARFESERQALAVMDHPNIARVFDAGATGRGRPYFVMELVDGIPITTYCDKKGMSIRERIELYIPVCQAIQHAHQKGIIHRDIKPSNVLVKQQEGTATPKVIDFGLAKALANPLGVETAVTEFGSVVGTLDYMSPEQAELGRQDVDTRSDVYSLGALLYELLTGAVPMEYDRASRPSYLDVLRWIQEKPVTPPSERAKQTGQSPEVAEKRGTVPPHLAKLLGRDLDWIIMKALEKDRTRRYETVNGLVRDLQRFLAGEPVEAGPPSAAYRLGKLARKHRVAIAIASSFVVLLSAFAVSIAVTNNRLSKERDRANLEAETARQVSSFLTRLFAISNPNESSGNAVTARELLDKGAERVNEELKAQPGVRASLLHSMGQAYDGLGLYARAQPLLVESLRLREQVFGPESLETAVGLRTLSNVQFNTGDLGASVESERKALAIRRKLLGNAHGLVAESLAFLGSSLSHKGDHEEAVKVLRESYALSAQLHGPEAEGTLEAMTELATALSNILDFAGAEPLFRQAVAIQERRQGQDSTAVARTLNDLGNLLARRGDDAAAEPVKRRSLASVEKIFGPDHPNTAIVRQNLAATLRKVGKLDEAEALTLSARAVFLERLGADHPRHSVFMVGLADIRSDRGDFAGAEELYRQAIAFDQAHVSSNRSHLAVTYLRYGESLLRKGDAVAAEMPLREGLAISAKTMPRQSPDLARHKLQLGRCLARLQRPADARPLLEESHAVLQATLGTEHAHTREAAAALAALRR